MTQLSQLLDQLGGANSASSVLENCEPPTASPEPNPDLLEHAQAMAQDSPDVFLKAAISIASVDFFTVLNGFDTVTLSRRLEEKPELYFQLINSQVNLVKASLEREKFQFKQEQAAARQRDRDQKLRARKPILLTAQTLTDAQRVLNSTHSRECESPDALPPASPAPDLGPQTQDPGSSTVNTGPCETLDFAVPPDFAPPIAAPDFEHPWSEQHSDALVCCPS